MLYDVRQDIAEASDVSAQHPEVVKELETLLNRYRDGGYSRELPPAGVKPKSQAVALPPLANAQAVDVKTFKSSRGKEWAARDGAMFGRAGAKGSSLSGPLVMKDGAFEFQILLGEADRHSLRIHTAENARSFRIVLSRAFLEVAKNPEKGEGPDKVVPLGKTQVKFKSAEWQTCRVTFQGDEITVQFAGTTTKAKHAIFAEPKDQLTSSPSTARWASSSSWWRSE
jgi:arylsulfatase A